MYSSSDIKYFVRLKSFDMILTNNSMIFLSVCDITVLLVVKKTQRMNIVTF